jgi:2,3,4,5-tetrahydropyridine-2-carboxylate N-succinyltransferase
MTDIHKLQQTVEAAYEERAKITPKTVSPQVHSALTECIELLDRGTARVAEPKFGGSVDIAADSTGDHMSASAGGRKWVVNEWLKKAVLLYFRTHDNAVVNAGYTQFFDKVPLKYADLSEAQLRESGTRVVPSAIARKGAYIAPNVVLMPSYVNIGAHVGSGSMVDTWVTVGSCAQIGKNVHLSGGVGIGGVLEPLQASPTIIEDDCFIGARSEVVEGVVVEAGSVLAMGTFIGQSTRIYDRSTGKITQGRVPAGSVVVPGTLPSSDGKYGLYCAVIVKRVDAQTRAKTSINELLRGTD